MVKYKTWRMMPIYGYKHDDNYKGYGNFKKKVLEPIIIAAAFVALAYVMLSYDKKSQDHVYKSKSGLERIVQPQNNSQYKQP